MKQINPDNRVVKQELGVRSLEFGETRLIASVQELGETRLIASVQELGETRLIASVQEFGVSS